MRRRSFWRILMGISVTVSLLGMVNSSGLNVYQETPINVTIYTTVRDCEYGDPIPKAKVTVFDPLTNTVLTSGITDMDGECINSYRHRVNEHGELVQGLSNGDLDSDGFLNGPGPWGAGDNCDRIPNPDQIDTDGDGAGDACDAKPNNSNPDGDRDGDGIPNATDNCDEDHNPGQVDTDGDGAGDACDTDGGDPDNDGIINSADNCDNDANASQVDSDSDGAGDLCDEKPNNPNPDGDPDGDGILNDEDNCDHSYNPDQIDIDQDGAGDPCDPDDITTKDIGIGIKVEKPGWGCEAREISTYVLMATPYEVTIENSFCMKGCYLTWKRYEDIELPENAYDGCKDLAKQSHTERCSDKNINRRMSPICSIKWKEGGNKWLRECALICISGSGRQNWVELRCSKPFQEEG